MYQYITFEDKTEGIVKFETLDPVTITRSLLLATAIGTIISFDIADKQNAQKLKRIAQQKENEIKELKSSDQFKQLVSKIEYSAKLAINAHDSTITNIKKSKNIKEIVSKLGVSNIAPCLLGMTYVDFKFNMTRSVIKALIDNKTSIELTESIFVFDRSEFQNICGKSYNDNRELYDMLEKAIFDCIPTRPKLYSVHYGLDRWNDIGFEMTIKI